MSFPRLAVAALLLAASGLSAGCSDEGESSLVRGDRLLAVDRPEEALAEYKLARRQKGDEPSVLLRLAHGYAVTGDADAAARHYRTLVAVDSAHRYQAAADLTRLAREASRSEGGERLARILEPVLAMGVDLVPRDLRLELARHWAERGEYARALPLFLAARSDSGGLGGRDLYWTARAFEELGGCREALASFETYLSPDRPEGEEVAGARWHYGNCLYRVARSDWRHGNEETALERLERLIELGVPRTLMDRAQYLKGELLLAEGRPQEALAAYREVLRLDPTRSGSLAQMAEARIVEIRYGDDRGTN